MTHEQLLQRITMDPDVCHGQPCVRGRRIWVSLVLDLLADGLTVEQGAEGDRRQKAPSAELRAK
jgi:uncharacterized protein (DUF433 family)